MTRCACIASSRSTADSMNERTSVPATRLTSPSKTASVTMFQTISRARTEFRRWKNRVGADLFFTSHPPLGPGGVSSRRPGSYGSRAHFQ